jgi:DNA-binding SARP family transcriptional activator
LLLGALALRVNRPTTAGTVREILWNGAPPKSAAANLRGYLAELRRLLAGTPLQHGLAIEQGPAGYRLRAEPVGVDLLQFTGLAEHGRRQLTEGDYHGAATTLARAEALWRGPVFGAELIPEPLQSDVQVIEMRRQEAIEDGTEARLASGRHQELTFELPSLIAQWPLRERLCSQYMLALYRSGRQVEALNAYHALRGRLDEEIGVLPSSGLQHLYRRMLRGDRDLDVVPALPSGHHNGISLCSCSVRGRVAGYLGRCPQRVSRPVS